MTSKQAKDDADALGHETPYVPETPEIDAITDEVEAIKFPPTPLKAAETERDELMARVQRLSADYMNYQKRAKRDIDQARLYANEDLIKALLPVIDDMERALTAARDNHGEDDPLFTGMQLVHDKAIETLGRFGVTAIEAVGKPFDPERHTALMQQGSDECEPNTVLQEAQRGYELRGRAIRPASVVISKVPDAPADGSQPED